MSVAVSDESRVFAGGYGNPPGKTVTEWRQAAGRCCSGREEKMGVTQSAHLITVIGVRRVFLT
jgi:hypothetical protein